MDARGHLRLGAYQPTDFAPVHVRLAFWRDVPRVWRRL